MELVGSKLRFIDLFAGLGGFHLALSRLGHKCVFASEINPDLKKLYQKNFDITPVGDIRQVEMDEIPEHDILCAGFPCQPFSKAGAQLGFDCPLWGTLFQNIIYILETHNPDYFILENVPNLVRHQGGQTWFKVLQQLRSAGYEISDRLLSPHHFGVPQIRERAFIVGAKAGLNHFDWPEIDKKTDISINTVLDDDPENARRLTDEACHYLNTWQEFLDHYPKQAELPSFPIWGMEFGANYPIHFTDQNDFLSQFKKTTRLSFGKKPNSLNLDAILTDLPTYARDLSKPFPRWKKQFIHQNRDFFQSHKSWLVKWLPKIEEFQPSYQKFEWNCKGTEKTLWDKVIQFRASGIRVKKANYAPSLVAMTVSQVPIIPWQRRFMTIRECARLQSMDELKYLPETYSVAAKALGNAVNADVVFAIAEHLLCSDVQQQGTKSEPSLPFFKREAS